MISGNLPSDPGEPIASAEARTAMHEWLRATLHSPASLAALATVLRDSGHTHHHVIVRDLERRGATIVRLSPAEYTRLRDTADTARNA